MKATARTRMYLVFSNWDTTSTTKKTFWMKESFHASQIIARDDILIAAATFSANIFMCT